MSHSWHCQSCLYYFVGVLSWNIIGLLPFPILTCPSSFITFFLLPSFSVLPISQDWLAQKQSFFDIYAALFHAYISYLIMWCDCYMSQSLISHHVTGYALFHLFFHHCITFWWLAQPVTAFWWLTQPVITFWWRTACSGFTLPHWCLYIYLLMQLFCNNNHLHITECILTINHHHLYSIDYCLSCDHPSKSSICILVTVPTPVYKYTTVQEVFCAKPRPFYSPTYTSLC